MRPCGAPNSLARQTACALLRFAGEHHMSDPTVTPNISQAEPASVPPPNAFRTLRAWPALVIAILLVAARFGPGLFEEGAAKYWMVSVFGPLLCCLLLVIWWLAASRATWRERVFGFLGLVAGVAISLGLAHP